MDSEQVGQSSRRLDRWRFGRLHIASFVLLSFVLLAYVTRPNGLAGFFVWPIVVWSGLGFAIAIAAYRSPGRHRIALTLVWFFVWMGFDDQPPPFMPQWNHTSGRSVTIVTMNCAGGDPRAAEEAAAEGADVILLQESPSTKAIQALRKSLGSEWRAVFGPDASILTNLPIQAIPVPKGKSNFTAAVTDDLMIVSLRLAPPVLNFEYWSPECWRSYATARERRKVELDEVMAWVSERLEDRKLIIGGDFNTPPDPWVQESLRQTAVDIFERTGVGWGGTAVNTAPFVRIDQIWVRGLEPATARVRMSRISDHRFVVAMANLKD